jgi:hypothetical protein
MNITSSWMLLAVSLALALPGYSQPAELLIYQETLTTSLKDQRGDFIHQGDSSGSTLAGLTASAFPLSTTKYWIFDVKNQRHTSIRYYTYQRYLAGRWVNAKEYIIAPIAARLPFIITPTYPAPSEQWLLASGKEETFSMNLDGSSIDLSGVHDLFAINGSTMFWSGKATSRVIRPFDNKNPTLPILTAVCPSIITLTGMELQTQMVTNFARLGSFPGYTYNQMASRPFTGKMVLSLPLSSKASTSLTPTVEAAVTLIETEKLTGYVNATPP